MHFGQKPRSTHTASRTGHRNSTQRDLQPPPRGPPPHSDQPGVPRQPANLQPSTPGGRPAFITKLITFLLFGLDSNVGSPRESPVCSPSSHGAPRFREPRSFPGPAPFGTRGAPAPSTTKSPPLLRRPALRSNASGHSRLLRGRTLGSSLCSSSRGWPSFIATKSFIRNGFRGSLLSVCGSSVPSLNHVFHRAEVLNFNEISLLNIFLHGLRFWKYGPWTTFIVVYSSRKTEFS